MFFRKKKAKPQSASLNYEILNRETLVSRQFEGWFEDGVAERQDAAYRQLLQEAYQGKGRTVVRVGGEAIVATGISKPDLLEVGCGSGYYSEILDYLLHSDLHYTGLDNSKAM